MIVEFTIKLWVVIQNELTEKLSQTMQAFTGENRKVVLWWDIWIATFSVSWKDKKEIDQRIKLYIQQFEQNNPDKKLTIVWEKILQ
jgi:hypothetical protein